MKRHVTRFLALVLTLGIAAAPTPVFASGFQLVEQNGAGLGNAFAGQAAGVTDASAIFYNPAALTSVEKRQFVISVDGVGVSNKFADTGSTRPSLGSLVFPVPLGGTGGEAGGWTPVPSAYFSWQASPRFWAGLGVGAPFGLKTEWDNDWVGRFHAVKSEVKTVNVNPTIAVKATDWLSLGVGADYQRLDAELSQNVGYGGISVGVASAAGGPAAAAGILAQLGGPAGLAREGLGQVKGDDWSWGWNAGVLARLGEPGRLGVSYRSKIKHTIEGDASFTGAPTFATQGPLGTLGSALNARFAPGPVSADVDLPDTLSVAAAYLGPKVEVLGDWTWTGWSSLQDLTVVRGNDVELSDVALKFRDTWRVGGGFNYRLNETWKLKLGVAYDKSPVQDLYRTPRLPDQGRTWVAAGFQARLGKGAVDVGYAHLFIKDASSTLPNQDAPPLSAPQGQLVGTYTAKVDIVSVQYRLSF